MSGELVPEPDVKHGIRANHAYREQFADRLAQAYSENVISKAEADARAAAAMREGVTTDELRHLTRDLPEPAEPAPPAPHPSARTRAMLYIATGAACFALAIAGPVAATAAHAHGTANLLLALMAVIICIAGIAGIFATVFAAVNDKVIGKEYQ